MNVEPVAVSGTGGRFPGGADSPDTFWRLLRAAEYFGRTPREAELVGEPEETARAPH